MTYDQYFGQYYSCVSFEYDSKHREISCVSKTSLSYNSSESVFEKKLNYSGLTRYGTSYQKGTITPCQKDTMEFLDDTFSRPKKSVSYIYNTNTSNIAYLTYEWIGDLQSKMIDYQELYDKNGKLINYSERVTTYLWADELNNTFKVKYYSNGKLYSIEEGYNKYTY